MSHIYTYICHIPIGSMYGIYANIGGILMVNVSIYTIHGSYGIYYRYPEMYMLDMWSDCVYPMRYEWDFHWRDLEEVGCKPEILDRTQRWQFPGRDLPKASKSTFWRFHGVLDGCLWWKSIYGGYSNWSSRHIDLFWKELTVHSVYGYGLWGQISDPGDRPCLGTNTSWTIWTWFICLLQTSPTYFMVYGLWNQLCGTQV